MSTAQQPSAALPLTGEALQAWARMRRMQGPGERTALLMALTMTPGSARERQAWAEETRGLASAEQALQQVGQLPPGARLPAVEMLLDTCSTLPLTERQRLLVGTRRMMCADGRVRPIDRLLLLLVRHRLTGTPPPHRGSARDSLELPQLPLALRQAIAQLSAYLARLVPAAGEPARVSAAGAQWCDAVLQAVWGRAPNPPACHVPDGHDLVLSLQALQSLGWMHRPVLARTWVDLAHDTRRTGGVTLDLAGAEALRIACGLLDTPVPPALESHFHAPPAGA